MTLTEYLHAVDATFSWPENNCCHFAAGWMKVVRGQDLMAGVERIEGKREALEAIKKRGRTLVDAVSSAVGSQPVTGALARTGDIVFTSVFKGVSLGICSGRHAVFLSEADGLIHCPIELCSRAWRL